MRLRFLGTGTSNGVPLLGCHCKVCSSSDPRDRRWRTAALVETANTRMLIDCGPDIREQLLPVPFRKIDGVLLTHAHYDHVAGLDDLRPYCKFGDIDIYGNAKTVDAVRLHFPYCFVPHLYPGVPRLKLHTIEKHVALHIGDIEVMPIEVMHDQLPILGYRIGKLAYITDMKTIDEAELAYLQGIETLVVNALRWEKPHHSHQLVANAVAFARRIGARRTYLIHLTHEIGLTDDANARLPHDVQLAYDGLVIEVE
jgi:phosphoribosyl 1,2-cyclic phosphate phosphodiesterase